MEPSQRNTSDVSGEIIVSRRGFLATVLASGTAVSLGTLSVPKVHEKVTEGLDRMSLGKRLSSEALGHRRAALRTAIETVVVWAGAIVVGRVADGVGIKHGGYAADGELYAESVTKAPLRHFVQENIAIPIVEEIVFRLLPSALFAAEGGPQVKLHWEVGAASTALFGVVHNLSKPQPDKIKLHLHSLPLEQLILGAYCWYAQRKGGFLHAAGAHILYNNLCALYEHRQRPT